MNTLALDLSTAQGSLAWSGRHSEVLIWPNDRKDSGKFFANVESVVRKFGKPDRIVVGLGPGSYAGIRIAISAATGLHAAGGGELVGCPSVCAIENPTGDYVVIGDARRQSFFFVRIRNRTVVGEYELVDENALWKRIEELPATEIVTSSDSLPRFQGRVERRFPSAEILGRLALESDRMFSQPPLEPIYLREANVTMPKPLFGGIAK